MKKVLQRTQNTAQEFLPAKYSNADTGYKESTFFLHPFNCFFFASSSVFLSIDIDTPPQTTHPLYSVLERRMQSNPLLLTD
jgi:hypothetical protein